MLQNIEPHDDVAPGLFDPFTIGSLTMGNRLAVAPMTRVSATEDGRATQAMADYYGAFAAGGFGLVVTEGIYTDRAFSQGYLFQPGLAARSHRDAWSHVVAGVHRQGARIFAQLMHAGALSQGNIYRDTTRGPSAVQPKGQQMAFYRGAGDYPVPEAMSIAEIQDAVRGFADAAKMAKDAGFDGVEIHGANGYLLDQFLTEGVNIRDDRYGGSVQARLHLASETVQAVRDAVGSLFPVGIRISQGKVNDFMHKWSGREEEAADIFGTLDTLPLDYVHTTEFEAWRPAFGGGASLAALAKRHSRLPVIANGSLHDPAMAGGLVDRGEADAVSLGRGALTHADWPQRVRQNGVLSEFNRDILSPLADLDNANRVRGAAIAI